jgi:mediator of RNA polymerase II transcription subunit 13
LGKWFVQPQEAADPASGNSSIPLKGSHLSFSISFFVHGESTVCASIDVRQHPVVRRITQRHLSAAQVSNGGVHGNKILSISSRFVLT